MLRDAIGSGLKSDERAVRKGSERAPVVDLLTSWTEKENSFEEHLE
jgi:hypothetical protein